MNHHANKKVMHAVEGWAENIILNKFVIFSCVTNLIQNLAFIFNDSTFTDVVEQQGVQY